MVQQADLEVYKNMQKDYFEAEAENMGQHNHIQHDSNPYLWQIGYGPLFSQPDRFRHGACLDFGCGGGRNMINMAAFNLFRKVDGCDIAEGNLIQSRLNFGKVYPDIESDLFANSGTDCLSPFNTRYEFIFSSIVLQHIPVRTIRNSILSDLMDLLTPKGTLSFQMAMSGKKIKKALGLPLRANAVAYFAEKTGATQTNGGCDVGIEDPQDLVSDLKALGATNVRWFITPSWEDLHPLWIWVHADKAPK